MAQDATLEGLRSGMLKSLYGRYFGLYGTSRDLLYLQGPADLRRPVLTTITSATTASTIIPPYGVTIAKTSDSSGTTAGWGLDYPVPGVRKTIIQDSSGYGIFTVPSGVYIKSTDLTTAAALHVPGRHTAELIGQTTGIYLLLTKFGSSVGTTEFVRAYASTAPGT